LLVGRAIALSFNCFGHSRHNEGVGETEGLADALYRQPGPGHRMAVAERIPACDAAGPYDVIFDEERRRPKKGKTRASASSWSSSSPSPLSFYVSPFAALLAMEIMAGVGSVRSRIDAHCTLNY
jgi:hypothetical protein